VSRPRQEIREAILTTARKLFARYGISRVTMNEIAREMRMGKSSLYHYYSGKEDLFQAVLEKEAQIFRSRIEAAVEEASSPAEKLRAYGINRMKSIKDLANVFVAFRDDYLRHYAFIRRLREQYDRYEVETVAGILRRGVADGAFSIASIELTAVAVATALKGFEYDWAISMTEEEIERNLDMLADLLVNGIARRECSP
jgi:AcrR family transcriptional regulator